ncbi:hypothetical protein ACB098_11G076800 [Castanea mollissima]
MLADGSALDCVKTPEKKLKQNDFWVDLKPGSNGSDIQLGSDKLRCEFEGFLVRFGKEICGRDCFRPLPPMLGDGQRVDLLKLLFAVRENGGCKVVSDDGLWDLVALESGLLGPNLCSTLKLIYIKYLDLLERWLMRVFDDNEHLMEFQDEIKDFLAKVPDQKKKRKDEAYPNLELEFKEVKSCADGEGLLALDSKRNVEKISDSKEGVIVLDGDMNGVGDEKKAHIDLGECVVNLEDNGKLFDNDEIEGVVTRLDGGSKCDDVVILDATNAEEESFCRKRKRESLCGLLNWVVGVAKDPCDPAIGSVPEWSVWKSHGKEEMWKQVLLAREAIFLKRQVESSADQWQKTQKMHPCMYDDQHGSNYNLRERFKCRKKLLSDKTVSQGRACSESSSASQSELDKNPCTEGMEDGLDKYLPGTSDLSTADSAIDKYASALEKYVPKRIPYGPRFEANVPEWTGVASENESDPKWLGTQVWPLEKVEHRYLIERDPIGKGRQDSCGCEVPGSIECVRFHIAEKRLRVKLELGSAFYRWKFDRMGEEVKISWTEEEEKKFEAILRSTPPPLQKCFWDQIFKIFPTKSRADLVSYYFNVYLLHRRGYQNRVTPNNIDSDDEEESGLVTNGNGHEADKSPNSILYSPKKPYANFR